jgi:serine/threonine protein kinase/WD40 repeat protein
LRGKLHLQSLNQRYQVERELGRGGMATVYLALDLKLHRRVALKLLRPELAAMLGPERFLREVEIAAQLSHPHILPLHDSGEAEGRLFYAMPYVDGGSLREKLERESQLSIEETLRIAQAVASALDYAHGQGVIHRDIKPENILLQGDEALVADFGVAVAVSSASRERLTETGLSLGTPAYMSPEQAAATSRLDGRSDQYSLACVVYEMLAGEPPYTGPSAQAIIAKRFREPVPHLSTLRAVPSGVEVALSRALSRAPADRFGTVGQFSNALAREAAAVRKPGALSWRVVLPSRRTVATLSAASVLAMVAVLALGDRPAPSPPLRRQITFTGRTGSPAISPDGKWLAYVSGYQAGNQDLGPLKVQPLPTGDPITLADSVFDTSPVWSPDGNNLMFVGRTRSSWFVGIQTVARVGGRVTSVAPLSWVYGYRPDGRALIRATFDTLVIQDILSGAEIRRINLAGKLDGVGAVEWALTGRWIALSGSRSGRDLIALIRPDGSEFRVLVEDGYAPRWAGERLYFKRRTSGGMDLFRLDVDLGTGQPRGESRLVLSGLGDGLSITRDAATLVYSRAPTNVHIWAIALEGHRPPFRSRTLQLTSGTRGHGWPDISSDGRSVSFLNDDGLFVMPFAGDSSPRWVAKPSGTMYEPRWAPDGSKLAFALHDSSGAGLFIADQATGRVARVGTREPNLAPELSWSPDGGRLVFAADGRRQLFLLDLATGRDSSLQWESPYRVFSPRWSPDGREIVATDFIGVDDFDGIARSIVGTGRWSHRKTEIANIRFLRWTADGWIYAGVTARGGGSGQLPAVHRMPASGGGLAPYFELPIHCDIREMAMSADARRFVCTVLRHEPDVWMVQNFDPRAR